MSPTSPPLPEHFLIDPFPCTPLSLLEAACDLLGTSTAYYAYLDEHHMHIQQVVHAVAAKATCPIIPDSCSPLAETYCQYVYRHGQPLIVPDARNQAPFAQMPVTAKSVIGSYVGVPLLRQDGTILGTLCCTDPEPLAFSKHDAKVLQILALSLAVCLERQELQDQLEQQHVFALQAYRDALTDLPNRRAFDEALTANIMQAATNRQPLAVIFLDLDHFKAWNDSYGHDVGDRILQHVALRLSATLRKQDQLFRLGGEEFVIMIPATAPAIIAILAERLRLSIYAPIAQIVPELHDDGTNGGYVSASFGIALYPLHAANSQEVLRQADKAMYQAKRLGRNQVCIATSDGHFSATAAA